MIIFLQDDRIAADYTAFHADLHLNDYPPPKDFSAISHPAHLMIP
jgi:hypothetical protein